MSDPRLLLDPVRLGPARVRNRVFVAPHTTNFGVAGENLVTDRHIAYHRARAAGGAGLIITEGIRVHPTSLRRLGLHAYDDRALPGLTALADAVHGEGTALFAQLLHTGRHSGDEHQGTWGASTSPWSPGAAVPHVMNALDIGTVLEGFGSAAERVVAAGFDGMEVHLGHGHLLQQFLSPVTNDRTDAYGGSFANRLRLAREAIAVVRQTVAGRAAVGVRLSADEFLPGGLGPDDVVTAVAALLEDGPLDFLHVSHSAYVGAPSLSTQMADMSYGRAPFRHLPARFKREFPGIPVLAICRLDDLATGAELVEQGEADLVGFARAHIAEPALTRKTLSATERPRSCIACNQGCNANLEAVVPITCTVNPAVGRERAWAAAEASTPAARDVLVVGAGPAGIEAAVTAARRGHRVVLADEQGIGGRLTDVARLGTRSGFGTLLRELRAALDASGVHLRVGTRLDADAVAAADPDVLVLAAGALPAPDALALPGGPPVLDLLDAVRDPGTAGARCLVLDDLGTWEAVSLAEQLAADGVAVHLVTPLAGLAPHITVYSRLALAERLGRAGVRFDAMHRIVGAAGRDVRIAQTVDGVERTVHDLDAVVHVRPPRARADILDGLIATGWRGDVHLVGDAFAPRTAQEAVAEGRAAGLMIGVADPAIAAGIGARPPYRPDRSAA